MSDLIGWMKSELSGVIHGSLLLTEPPETLGASYAHAVAHEAVARQPTPLADLTRACWPHRSARRLRRSLARTGTRGRFNARRVRPLHSLGSIRQASARREAA